jgi:hypothetical protein
LHHRRATKIRKLDKARKEILDCPEFNENEDLCWEEVLIASQIVQLENLNSKNQQAKTKVRIACHSERMGGIWSNLSKSNKLRDIITRLEIPSTEPRRYKVKSHKIAKIVKQHHQNLQNKDLAHFENEEDREDAITEVLNVIPEEQKYPATDGEEDLMLIAKDQVVAALQTAKNKSATGLDGCPYELWKLLNRKHKEASNNNKPSFNIANTLTLLFQDIQQHGITKSTDFSGRWMCPIYKKKDKTRIENYHPITLLNTRLQTTHQGPSTATHPIDQKHGPPRPSQVHPRENDLQPHKTDQDHDQIC